MWLCCPSCRTKCTKYCILIGKRREFLCDEKDFPFSKVHKNFWRLWTEVLWPKCICFPPSCLRQVGSCAISNGYKAAHVTHPGWVTPQISGKSRKISGRPEGIMTGLVITFFWLRQYTLPKWKQQPFTGTKFIRLLSKMCNIRSIVSPSNKGVSLSPS